MRALVVIAHGSRREASNKEVVELAEQLRKISSAHFERIEPAFLELAEPGIDQVINSCVVDGAERIVIAPYFLSAGRHVVEDVPSVIRAAQARFPAVEFRLAAHIGAASAMPRLLLESVF